MFILPDKRSSTVFLLTESVLHLTENPNLLQASVHHGNGSSVSARVSNPLIHPMISTYHKLATRQSNYSQLFRERNATGTKSLRSYTLVSRVGAFHLDSLTGVQGQPRMK
jgi:hypothetical protein